MPKTIQSQLGGNKYYVYYVRVYSGIEPSSYQCLSRETSYQYCTESPGFGSIMVLDRFTLIHRQLVDTTPSPNPLRFSYQTTRTDCAISHQMFSNFGIFCILYLFMECKSVQNILLQNSMKSGQGANKNCVGTHQSRYFSISYKQTVLGIHICM